MDNCIVFHLSQDFIVEKLEELACRVIFTNGS